MEYSSRTDEHALVLTMSGKLTMRDHDAFRKLVEGIATSESGTVVFGLEELEFVDSAGLGMFLLAQDTARAKGKRVVLRRPKPHVRRLLEVACFHTLFAIEQD